MLRLYETMHWVYLLYSLDCLAPAAWAYTLPYPTVLTIVHSDGTSTLSLHTIQIGLWISCWYCRGAAERAAKNRLSERSSRPPIPSSVAIVATNTLHLHRRLQQILMYSFFVLHLIHSLLFQLDHRQLDLRLQLKFAMPNKKQHSKTDLPKRMFFHSLSLGLIHKAKT